MQTFNRSREGKLWVRVLRRSLPMIFRLLLFAFAALLAQAQQTNPLTFYNTEKEAALGAQVAQSIQQRTDPVSSPAVQAYIAGIGDLLRAYLPDRNQTFTFRVVLDSMNGSTREPLAVPGGYVFVSARLILDARNEAELAGMLAHAMAHIAEHHATRVANQNESMLVGDIPLVFMGGWVGNGDAEPRVPMKFLKVQQEHELEADRDAVRIMYARVTIRMRCFSILRAYNRLTPRCTRAHYPFAMSGSEIWKKASINSRLQHTRRSTNSPSSRPRSTP